MRAYEFLTETTKPKVGRILQHAEDLVIVDGSKGALEALNKLEAIATSVDDVSIKFDGSPACYFGRNENGEFVLTDKSGYMAKGYDGKVTSANDLETMLLSRGKVEPDDSRKQFAGNMAGLWDKFESIVDPDVRGYFFGDLLYFNTPPKNEDGEFVFAPNTVQYEIPSESELGKKIARTSAGIVLHAFTDLEGNTTPIKGPIKGIDESGQVLVVGPMSVSQPPKVNTDKIKQARNFVQKHASMIDTLLDDAKLVANKLSDFRAILYKFVNQQVGSGDLTDLNVRFDKWLEISKVSKNKQAKINDMRTEQPEAFGAVFEVLELIMQIKDEIIDELDQSSPIKSSINGTPGGEGYVKGNIKLVPRSKFTAANIAKHS